MGGVGLHLRRRLDAGSGRYRRGRFLPHVRRSSLIATSAVELMTLVITMEEAQRTLGPGQ
jgi:hypothetical protein